jgi:hypothetical protein
MSYKVTAKNLQHFRWQIIADYVSAKASALGFNPRLTEVMTDVTDAEVTLDENLYVQIGDGYYVVHTWNPEHTALVNIEGKCSLKKEIAEAVSYWKKEETK